MENSMDLGRLVGRVAERWQLRAALAVRPAELTYLQFQLMAALSDSPGATQAAVARLVGTDAMTASVKLRKLERRRLIARQPNALDSRALRLTLTESGVAVLTQARDLLARAAADFFGSVGPQRPEFAAALGALIGQRPRVRVAMRRNAAG